MHWDSWNGIRKERGSGEGRRQKARKEGRENVAENTRFLGLLWKETRGSFHKPLARSGACCVLRCFDAAAAKLLQSCPTLCDPKDGSPPGSPVPGILQARTLEWVAISFSNA